MLRKKAINCELPLRSTSVFVYNVRELVQVTTKFVSSLGSKETIDCRKALLNCDLTPPVVFHSAWQFNFKSSG